MGRRLHHACGAFCRFWREESRVPGGAGRGASASSGQALAEFAFAFPLQLIFTFGVLQLMFLMISSLVINYASVRCARAALVYYNPDDVAKTIATITPVAQIILAPVAFHRVSAEGSNLTVPGWGALGGSGAAYAKIKLDVTNTDGAITTKLTFKQELLFPFVDRLFAMVAPDSAPKGQGRSFGGETQSNGGVEVLNGRVHFLISRTHTLRRDKVIENVAPPSSNADTSSVYNYDNQGW